MLIAIKFSELVKNKYDPVPKGRCLCGKCVNSEFSTKKGGFNNSNLVFHLFLKHTKTMYEYTVKAPFCARENWNKMTAVCHNKSSIISAEGGWVQLEPTCVYHSESELLICTVY
jgi:hypothetical protein